MAKVRNTNRVDSDAQYVLSYLLAVIVILHSSTLLFVQPWTIYINHACMDIYLASLVPRPHPSFFFWCGEPGMDSHVSNTLSFANLVVCRLANLAHQKKIIASFPGPARSSLAVRNSSRRPGRLCDACRNYVTTILLKSMMS